MGEREAKLTGASTARAEGLVEELRPLGEVSSRKMFGGHGVFCGGVMFALVDSDGDSFVRVDDDFRAELEAQGSTSHGRMPYMSVHSSDEALLALAGRSLEIARAARR
ncbi:MAG: TfoX/Sxy family protein [Thermoleophilia bacterium]|nr:TfoX/Sxy family protein [Thermoleophilia bacterium]